MLVSEDKLHVKSIDVWPGKVGFCLEIIRDPFPTLYNTLWTICQILTLWSGQKGLPCSTYCVLVTGVVFCAHFVNVKQDLQDGLNYGLFCPPDNGRAGKFMDEERQLTDYALPGPIGYLEVTLWMCSARKYIE